MVELVLDKQDGNEVVVGLLRNIEWVKRERVQVGGLLRLDRQEMGRRRFGPSDGGGACPELPRGPGRRVTATFRHHAGVVLDLSVEGEGKAIGVTPTHLVWSPDRQAWVPVGEMRVGEGLAATNGSTPCVLSLKQREQPEEVFNIEVDGDHVYRVGEQGLLVHNASADPNTCDPCGFGKKIKRKPQARPPKKIRPKKPSGGGGGGAGGGGGGGGLRPIQDFCYMKQTDEDFKGITISHRRWRNTCLVLCRQIAYRTMAYGIVLIFFVATCGFTSTVAHMTTWASSTELIFDGFSVH